MQAEYPNPSTVPDIPDLPGTSPDLPEIPPDPTSPGGDPEPQDARMLRAAQHDNRRRDGWQHEKRRRAEVLLVAMLLAVAPAVVAAQSLTTTASQTPVTPRTPPTHGLFGVRRSWIAMGGVVVAVLFGLVAMSGNRTTSATSGRE